MLKKLRISLIYSYLVVKKQYIKSPYAELVRKSRQNFWCLQEFINKSRE